MSFIAPDADIPRHGARPSLFGAEAQAAFRRFVGRRLPDRAAADDVLQQALAKTWETGAHADARHPTAWFYQVLRNAVADFHRERATRDKREARYANEETSPVVPPEDTASDEPCACFKPLLGQLRPEYAEILRVNDLEGRTPRETAAHLGISSGNANVRLHRARAALRKGLHEACGHCASHGCRTCTCASHRTSDGAGHARSAAV